jgi:nitrogenase molybdenum-iron protein NifN
MKAKQKEAYVATKNACKLCSPLGASLVFKGIRGSVPLLHGSQGCSTYIRRYLISHFKEPVDIACSNFAEQTAIFGGGANLKIALENILRQYTPELIGVATTCLSETIGDDVPMFIKEYHEMHRDETLPPIVHVSTPSYQGTHMQGFHASVRAIINNLATTSGNKASSPVNLFPGMLSPEDLRHLKEILSAFGLPFMVLPDYSQTLDGPLWAEYQRIPPGGTTVESIRQSGSALASVEFGKILAHQSETAGTFLDDTYAIPHYRLGLPVGIQATDEFLGVLETISGRPTPNMYIEQRGRLLDSLVDGHKYVNQMKAVVFGEEDLVAAMACFMSEIGVVPVLCASGGTSGHLESVVKSYFPNTPQIHIMQGADFVDIEQKAQELQPDLLIGNSKGYSMARRMNVPLIRIGFPIHDRLGGARLLHVGYHGAQQLFDRIANTLIEKRQQDSAVGYTYM